MTRQECYDFIKSHELQNDIKNVFNRVYSAVSTAELIKYIEEYNKEQSSTNNCNDCNKSTGYEALEHKYNTLVYALAAMKLSIDDDSIEKDIQNAVDALASKLENE